MTFGGGDRKKMRTDGGIFKRPFQSSSWVSERGGDSKGSQLAKGEGLERS